MNSNGHFTYGKQNLLKTVIFTEEINLTLREKLHILTIISLILVAHEENYFNITNNIF